MPKWKIKDAINRHHSVKAIEQMGEKLNEIKDIEIGKTDKRLYDDQMHLRL